MLIDFISKLNGLLTYVYPVYDSSKKAGIEANTKWSLMNQMFVSLNDYIFNITNLEKMKNKCLLSMNNL